jgi:hypothetical protein
VAIRHEVCKFGADDFLEATWTLPREALEPLSEHIEVTDDDSVYGDGGITEAIAAIVQPWVSEPIDYASGQWFVSSRGYPDRSPRRAELLAVLYVLTLMISGAVTIVRALIDPLAGPTEAGERNPSALRPGCMGRMRKFATAVVALFLAAALGACGNGEGQAVQATAPAAAAPLAPSAAVRPAGSGAHLAKLAARRGTLTPIDPETARLKITGEQALRVATGPSFAAAAEDRSIEESLDRATVPAALAGPDAHAAGWIENRNVWVVYFGDGVDIPVSGTPDFHIPGKTAVPVPMTYRAELYSLIDATGGELLESGSL